MGSSRRPPHAHRVPAPKPAPTTRCPNQLGRPAPTTRCPNQLGRPAPTTRCPNQLGRPTTDRIERHAQPIQCMKQTKPARTRRVARPGQRPRLHFTGPPTGFPERFEPVSTGGVARRPPPGSPSASSEPISADTSASRRINTSVSSETPASIKRQAVRTPRPPNGRHGVGAAAGRNSPSPNNFPTASSSIVIELIERHADQLRMRGHISATRPAAHPGRRRRAGQPNPPG